MLESPKRIEYWANGMEHNQTLIRRTYNEPLITKNALYAAYALSRTQSEIGDNEHY